MNQRQYLTGADAPGTNVREYQRMLIELGYLPPGSDTGVKDAATLAAVKKFQIATGLGTGGDVGPITLAAMSSAIAAKRAKASSPLGQASLIDPLKPGQTTQTAEARTTAPTAQPEGEKPKVSTALIVGLSLGGVALTGGILYFVLKASEKKTPSYRRR